MLSFHSHFISYLFIIFFPFCYLYLPYWKWEGSTYQFPNHKISNVYLYNTKREVYTFYNSNNETMISIDEEQYIQPVSFALIGSAGENNGVYYLCPKDKSKNIHIFYSSNLTMEEVVLNKDVSNYYLICDFIPFPIGVIFTTYSNTTFQGVFIISTKEYIDRYNNANVTDVFPLKKISDSEYQLVEFGYESNKYPKIFVIIIFITYGDSFSYSSIIIWKKTNFFDVDYKYLSKTENPYTFYFYSKTNNICYKDRVTIATNAAIEYTRETMSLSFISDQLEVAELKFISKNERYFYFDIYDFNTYKYHRGLADILYEKVLFNYRYLCDYISPNLDSDNSYICSYLPQETFLVCPFIINSSQCDFCSSDELLLINPFENNNCYKSTITIDNATKDLFTNCNTGYAPSGSECKPCSDLGYLTLQPEGECVASCEETEGAKNTTDQTCTICKDISKSLYQNQCVEASSLPSNTYVANHFYNYYKDCDPSCGTCEYSNSYCMSCSGSSYLYSNTCVDVCPDNYGKYIDDTNNQLCINCKEKAMYKYETGEDCIDLPEGTGIIKEEFNIIKDCDTQYCNKCVYENGQEKCIECIDSYFLYEDNTCTDSCGYLFYQDSTLKKCINCFEEYQQYKKENVNQCVDLPTDHGTFIVISKYGIYADCYSTCASCVMEGTSTQNNCNTCVDGSAPVNSNCDTPCEDPLGQYDGQCINCKAKGLFKYKGDGQNCISFPGSDYIITNDEYGIIEQCYPLCETCSIIGKSEEQQECNSCKSGYYLKDKNCVSSCDSNYVQDENKRQCINCKLQGNYKIEGTNECIDSEIEGYFESESAFGILSKCDSNCKLCVTSSTNCIGCENGQYLYDATCVLKCPEKYGIYNKECKNCKKVGMIKFQDQDECENVPTNSNFYYIDELFGLITYCTDDIEQCKKETREEENLVSVINNIDYDILSYYNSTNSEIVTDQYTLQVYDTTTPKETAGNESSIELGNCEDLLKSSNSIPSSEPLIIYKLDIVTNESSLVNEVKYSVFDIRGNKLDLSVCDSIGVNVSVPIKESSGVNITKMSELTEEGINVFNKSDPFFNDICIPYDSDDSAGLPFSKRKDLYVSSTVCSIGCELVSIDNTTNKANCKCGLKDAKATANQLKDKFSDTILNSNFFVVKCVHAIFNKDNIKKNIGFFTFAGLFGCQVINIIYFMITSVKPIKLVIMNVIDKGVTVANPIKKENRNDSQITSDSRHLQRLNTHNNLIREDNKKNTYIQQSPSEKHLLPKHDVNSIKIYKPEDVYTSTRCFEDTTIIKHSYTEEELNDLSYDMAILYDTRSFCSLYGNYMKYKQPILNAFIVKTDTTLKSVKIAMLFLSIAMSFSFNALFFTESIQNKNYETNGNISILVTLPKVILSCVASVIISTILSLISSFDSKIKRIKEETNKEDLKQKVPTYINSIKCKLTVFFVIMSILMLFFWYFVSAFCSVYPKYQKIWLTDSLKSLGLTMFFPFLYALGVTIFRYIGIKKKNSCSFCFAKVINII